MKLLEVAIWNQLVGVLIWDDKKQITSFEYAKSFISKGIQVSPLIHPLSSKIITSKINEEDQLDFDSNKGLPLFLSDSLPDKFGTDLFAKYLEKEGKTYRNLSPLEKLAYIGNRGMGALEFRPSMQETNRLESLDLKKLEQLSKSLLNDEPISNLADMANLFHIGTSPGGAQPKVLINIDKKTGDIYRGDNLPTDDHESWILKFNKDTGQESDQYRGKTEYAYYLMARKAKINITDSKLMNVEGDYVFMTKRFDRKPFQKIHTQTLHALAGMNFKLPYTYSYEQIFSVLNQMNMDYPSKEQLFRTMVFNVISRNVDDHTKNFGFNRSENGDWEFSPAYDLTFSYNDNFNRETPHFLSINGKNENINLKDILVVAYEYGIKKPKNIINEVNQALLEWPEIARGLNISEERILYIESKMRTLKFLIK